MCVNFLVAINSDRLKDTINKMQYMKETKKKISFTSFLL